MPLRIAAIATIVILAALNLYQLQDRPGSTAGPQRLRQTLGPAEREIVDRYTELFATTKNTFWPNRWLGIQTLQNPNDVWVTQEIIVEVKPDILVETGTYNGGSAALWAMLLEQVNPQGRVLTIDIEEHAKRARRLPIVQRRVRFLVGSSTAPEIVSAVAEEARGKRVMVLLDSAHNREHVLAELEAYAPMVSVGSYLIVQDTGGVMIGDPHAGPLQAVEEFLARDERFEVDRSRERMLMTMHPMGYLKRVR